MTAAEFIWHLINLFAVSVLFAVVVAAGAKIGWRRRLRAVAWWRLAALNAGVAMVVTVAGAIAFGRDGRMATYALMVLAAAALVGWFGRAGPR